MRPTELRLLLRSGITALEAAYVEQAVKAGGVFLTSNVFIVGTVNVDETTHVFSPKVLDRSFVLEFPTFEPSKKPDQFEVGASDSAQSKSATLAEYLISSPDLNADKTADEFLDSVYAKLGRFRFGPRVTMESQRYVAAVKATAAFSPEEFIADGHLKDRLLMQKVLPKLHGNRSQLGKVILGLLELASDQQCQRSIEKLESMAADLKSPGFTSFFA